MRCCLLALLLLAISVPAAESTHAFPLWDGKETVEAYAKRVNLPATKSVDLGGGVSMELVLIPAGKFVMGSAEPAKPTITLDGATLLFLTGAFFVQMLALVMFFMRGRGRKFTFSLRTLLLMTLACGMMVGGGARCFLAREDAARYAADRALYDQLPDEEKPGHRVTLAQPFYMGKYTVTQAQYEAVVGNNPSHFKGAQLPVETVSWNDATAFCAKLNDRFKVDALDARLPTEAQWEFACRAGSRTQFYSGDQYSDLDDVAWYESNSSGKTHPVGTKKSNAFGLYDMHGNVRQWCHDAFHLQEANSAHPFDEQYAGRALRGGSWTHPANSCRSAFRENYDRSFRSSYDGFRIVVPVPTAESP
jgi:formylglycine-generating enzyme required for sulfatase activity